MFAPGVLDLEQSFAIDFDSLLDRVGVAFNNSLTLAPAAAKDSSAAAEQEFIVDL
jgi:hypothetical protein